VELPAFCAIAFDYEEPALGSMPTSRVDRKTSISLDEGQNTL